jgi:hypothetical protein
VVFHGGLAFLTLSVLVAVDVRRFDCWHFCFARSLVHSGMWRGATSSGSVVLGCSVSSSSSFRWFSAAWWSGRVFLAVLLM